MTPASKGTIACQTCGTTMPAGTPKCPFCAEAVPGSLTLREALPDFDPKRFDLHKLRWSHRALLVLLVLLVLGVLIGFAWLDDPAGMASFANFDYVVYLGLAIALILFIGIPVGIYLLIRALLKRRRKDGDAMKQANSRHEDTKARRR